MGEGLLTFLLELGELAADIIEAKMERGPKKKKKKKGMERKSNGKKKQNGGSRK